MAKSAANLETQDQLQTFLEALESGTFADVRHMLRGMSAAEIAHLIESSPPRERKLLWPLIDKDDESEVLQYLDEEIAAHFMRDWNAEEILSVAEDFEPDDLADLLQELPRKVMFTVLESMDEQNRRRVEAILAYPDDSAGRLMNTDIITIRPDISLDVVLRYLRRHESLPDATDALLVVNRSGKFVGKLPLTTLLMKDPGMLVREAMMTDCEVIRADLHSKDVASIFEREDLVSAPVVDADGLLLGRITVDDVVDVILEGADHSLMSMAGLDVDEDTFAPVTRTVRRRVVWLAVNLVTAFLAAQVIGLFEESLAKVVALAILMPIVASMGGIAGTQALTLVIRGMALGQVGFANARWLFSRELVVGLINGLIAASVIGTAAWLWFGDPRLGMVLGAAMVINLMTATVAGATIPLLLKRMGIDPALSGGVILTTITDCVGFFAFLGLATLLIL